MKSITAPSSTRGRTALAEAINHAKGSARTETLGCARKGRAELREREERSYGQDEDAR